MVGQINENLIRKEIQIRLSKDAAQYILDETLTDRSYGARPLRRATEIRRGSALGGADPRRPAAPALLEVYREADGLYYRPVPEDVEEVEGEETSGDTAVAVAQGKLLYAFSS
ncbi:MAG: hypothetical protein R2724_21065 [Bryobacterales bacterium]